MHIVASDISMNSRQPNYQATSSFLGFSGEEPEVMRQVYKHMACNIYPRQELVNTLAAYNLQLGNDTLALQNIERLISNEQGCIVTGQQLGLMGGPAYTILKGISCLIMARKYGAVPIFWLATEDNDIAEIDHTYLLDSYGNLKYFHLSLPKDGRAVEDLSLSEKNLGVINQFLDSAFIDKKQCPDTGSGSYAQIMAQFMVRLFADTGMVFVEPKLLRPLARSFFKREIEDCENLQHILKETTGRLIAAGGKETIVFNNGTNLFLKDAFGRRCKIHYNGKIFQSGEQDYIKKDLLFLVDEEPWRFSTNVAARPVLQSLLIPTLAYVAGPSEMEYFCQLGDYHKAHGVTMPYIAPRLSATLIPEYAVDILSKCHIDPDKEIPLHWGDLLPFIQEKVVKIGADWRQSTMKELGNAISSNAIEHVIKHSIFKLQRKVVKSYLQSQRIPSYGLHLLRNLIHPHQKKQERVLNWWGFQGYTKENLIKEILKLLSSIPQKHVLCYCDK